jgi:hypothetical protein
MQLNFGTGVPMTFVLVLVNIEKANVYGGHFVFGKFIE